MVIRVSGYPGSRKTTLCKQLAEALGLEVACINGAHLELKSSQTIYRVSLS